MGPVQDEGLAVVAQDDVLGIEVAVAELLVVGHALQSRVQLVAGGGVQTGFVDLAVHLVLELAQQRAGLRVHFQLQIHEQIHIFVTPVGVFLHEPGEGFAGDKIADDGPLAPHRAHLVQAGDVEGGFLHAGLVERLNGLVGADRNHLVQFHDSRPPYLLALAP